MTETGAPERRDPIIVDKPWGREVWYAHTERYAGKILEVDEGHILSLQKHEVKHETLYLQSGLMRFTLGSDVFEWTPGEVVMIPPQTVHRMEALEDSVILEVSTPELDDVVRLEDRYGRIDED
ncbi:MAG: cupin domain-containing protein [Gemmatimonadota bacterium]|nr:cupin domain-containing protein [Gemmatimonadota bacterium]